MREEGTRDRKRHSERGRSVKGRKVRPPGNPAAAGAISGRGGRWAFRGSESVVTDNRCLGEWGLDWSDSMGVHGNLSGLVSNAGRAAGVAAIFVMAVCASAQSEKKADEPLLKGPAVKERAVPGVSGSFGQSQEARRMGERIPPEVLREALSVLTRDDAPADVRATAEQEAEFNAVTDELRAAARAYMAQHRDELVTLRKDANLTGRAAQEIDRAIGRPRGQGQSGGPVGGAGRPERMKEKGAGENPGDAPVMDEATAQRQEAARQRLRELMAGAPKVEDSMTRVWAKLSPAQREAVDTKLNEFREREAKRREEMYVQQKMGEREKGRPQGAAGGAGSDDAMTRGEKPGAGAGSGGQRPKAMDAERRERLMRLFASLSPEQQDVLLERLENAAKDGGLGGGGVAGRQRGPRPGQNTDKPAPGMDEVDVPAPADVEAPDASEQRRRKPKPD